jgi:hypothetical protein
MKPLSYRDNALFFLQRNADPVNFTPDKIVGIVRTLRPAENHGASMSFKRFGERVTIAGPADVEWKTISIKPVPYVARRRMQLMHDQEHRKPSEIIEFRRTSPAQERGFRVEFQSVYS